MLSLLRRCMHPLVPTAQPAACVVDFFLFGFSPPLKRMLSLPFRLSRILIRGCCLACLCCAAEAVVASCGFGREPIVAWQAVSSVLAGHERHPVESQAAEFDGDADVSGGISDIGGRIDLTRATSPRTRRAHEIGRDFSEAIADEACNELQQPSAARAFAKWVSKSRDLHELGVAQPQRRYGS